MQARNPYTQYKEQSLSTMAPGELLVKLFDEVIKQCRLSAIAIRSKDYGQANDGLTKSQTIITTLMSSLDMRYPISAELREMYVFLGKQLLNANLQKDAILIEQVLPLIKDLRDSFEQADKISRQNKHVPAAVIGGRAV